MLKISRALIFIALLRVPFLVELGFENVRF